MREEFLRTAIHCLAAALLACNGEDVSYVARRSDASPGLMHGADSSPPKRLPNIVLIISDDQSWSDFGFMGSEIVQTPNIDALAAQGARFSLAFNSGNVCLPSLQSILTGYHPAQ